MIVISFLLLQSLILTTILLKSIVVIALKVKYSVLNFIGEYPIDSKEQKKGLSTKFID